MINLLPDTEKLVIRNEYRLRIVATILVCTLIAIIIAIILLLPSYILTIYKNNVAEEAIQKAPTAQTDQKEFAQKLKTAKASVQILRPGPVVLDATTIIDILNKNKTSRITITSISYDRDAKDVLNIGVLGVARTRQSLVDFTKSLQQDEHIATVDLPVSSFAEDTDIQFSLTIKTK